MVMQNQRLELLYNEAECYFYAITNCINVQDGSSNNPGFRVTTRSLNREIWQRLKSSFNVNSLDGEGSLSDDVALEILYCLLGGEGSEDYRDEIGWEITGIELHDESTFCIDVANRQVKALKDFLSDMDYQNAPPGQFVSTLKSQAPTEAFWVYWYFDELNGSGISLDIESLENGDEKYRVRVDKYLHITEDLSHRWRELYFHSKTIERDDGQYLPVDVTETLY